MQGNFKYTDTRGIWEYQSPYTPGYEVSWSINNRTSMSSSISEYHVPYSIVYFKIWSFVGFPFRIREYPMNFEIRFEHLSLVVSNSCDGFYCFRNLCLICQVMFMKLRINEYPVPYSSVYPKYEC